MPETVSTIRRRRVLFAALNLATFAIMASGLTLFLAGRGLSVSEIGVLTGFVLTMPYTIIGFWNAMIGLVLRHGGHKTYVPSYGLDSKDTPPRVYADTAIVLTLCNEVPDAIFERLACMRDSLSATGQSERFRFVILSDSDDPAIATAEHDHFAAFAAACREMPKPFYRRRARNVGYKAGNIADFLDYHGADYQFFVPLDSDSLVSGPVIVRLVAAMEARDEIGILQTLAVGMPSASGFARIFQFGMRHAMRAFTTGAAWWASDCGSYWGHNAIVRVDAFSRYCRLPDLPGRTPLGGAILSHDQLESAFMRRAGYQVRVVPIEIDSFEINPPTLLDFIRRELRWCQGNMQYAWFLLAPGLAPVSRFQLCQAMLMYIAPPAWIGMIGAACIGALTGGFQADDLALGMALFFATFFLAVTPKLVGVLDVVLSGDTARIYGGRFCFGCSVVLELAGSMLMAPVVAVSMTLFLGGLLLGRSVRWGGQNRDRTDVPWRTAARLMAPHTLAGLSIALILWTTAGAGALLWALPLVGGLSLAIPLAVFTASPLFGRALIRRRLFATPEEMNRPAIFGLGRVDVYQPTDRS